MNKKYPLSPRKALELANKSVWVTSGGYYFRNTPYGGEYRAYGEYPGCKRTCDRHTLRSFITCGPNWKLVEDD